MRATCAFPNNLRHPTISLATTALLKPLANTIPRGFSPRPILSSAPRLIRRPKSLNQQPLSTIMTTRPNKNVALRHQVPNYRHRAPRTSQASIKATLFILTGTHDIQLVRTRLLQRPWRPTMSSLPRRRVAIKMNFTTGYRPQSQTLLNMPTSPYSCRHRMTIKMDFITGHRPKIQTLQKIPTSLSCPRHCVTIKIDFRTGYRLQSQALPKMP